MVYKVIGVTSNGSKNELQLVYVHLQEKGGLWTFEILQAVGYQYDNEWIEKLEQAANLPAREYQVLHTAFGHYIAQQVNRFIDAFALHHRVDLIASHGHPAFHLPQLKTTAQLGDGAAVAAGTALPVVTDLRAIDIALGGQGMPIESIGDRLLFGNYDGVLRLGQHASLSASTKQDSLFRDLSPYTGEAMTQELRTAVDAMLDQRGPREEGTPLRVLLTGSAAKTNSLVQQIQSVLQPMNIVVSLPEALVAEYEEPLLVALMGVLRWREEYTVISAVTGATRNSIGGALWLGGEA